MTNLRLKKKIPNFFASVSYPVFDTVPKILDITRHIIYPVRISSISTYLNRHSVSKSVLFKNSQYSCIQLKIHFLYNNKNLIHMRTFYKMHIFINVCIISRFITGISIFLCYPIQHYQSFGMLYVYLIYIYIVLHNTHQNRLYIS